MYKDENIAWGSIPRLKAKAPTTNLGAKAPTTSLGAKAPTTNLGAKAPTTNLGAKDPLFFQGLRQMWLNGLQYALENFWGTRHNIARHQIIISTTKVTD